METGSTMFSMLRDKALIAGEGYIPVKTDHMISSPSSQFLILYQMMDRLVLYFAH